MAKWHLGFWDRILRCFRHAPSCPRCSTPASPPFSLCDMEPELYVTASSDYLERSFKLGRARSYKTGRYRHSGQLIEDVLTAEDLRSFPAPKEASS